MKTLFAAVAAQGAVPANSPAMPIFKQVSNLLQRSNVCNKWLKAGFSFLFGIFLFASYANAQGSVILAASDFNLRVTTSDGFVDAGKPAILRIELGDNDNPVNNAIEVEIELELDAGVIFPTDPIINTGNSWFFDPENSSLTVNADSDSKTIQVIGLSNVGVSGEGNFFFFFILAGSDGIQANHMINSTGGLVIIEDIGYKKPTTLLQRETRLFPNPFHDHLNFNWGSSVPNAVQVINQQGVLVMNLADAQIQNGRWTDFNLAPGIYHIKIDYPEVTEYYRVMRN